MSNDSKTDGARIGRITSNEDGTIDEIAAECQFHIEDLGDSYYLGLYPDGETRQFRISVEDGRVTIVPYDTVEDPRE
jgi:hypothetical protein